MKSLALGSAVTLILLTGLFVSGVEAKNDNADEKSKPNKEDKFVVKTDKHEGKGENKYEYQLPRTYTVNETRSVPLPGTLTLLGGGFAGLVVWRALRNPRR